jgi:hypothetical protein
MENQHQKSIFEAAVTSRYQQSVVDVLTGFQQQEYTCAQIALITGFTESTVRKYYRKYKLLLYPEMLKVNVCPYADLKKHIQANALSIRNVLYRSWHNADLTVITH